MKPWLHQHTPDHGCTLLTQNQTEARKYRGCAIILVILVVSFQTDQRLFKVIKHTPFFRHQITRKTEKRSEVSRNLNGYPPHPCFELT